MMLHTQQLRNYFELVIISVGQLCLSFYPGRPFGNGSNITDRDRGRRQYDDCTIEWKCDDVEVTDGCTHWCLSWLITSDSGPLCPSTFSSFHAVSFTPLLYIRYSTKASTVDKQLGGNIETHVPSMNYTVNGKVLESVEKTMAWLGQVRSYSEAKASVPGTSSKLGEWVSDWVRDFSPRASSAVGAQQKQNLAQGYPRGEDDARTLNTCIACT